MSIVFVSYDPELGSLVARSVLQHLEGVRVFLPPEPPKGFGPALEECFGSSTDVVVAVTEEAIDMVALGLALDSGARIHVLAFPKAWDARRTLWKLLADAHREHRRFASVSGDRADLGDLFPGAAIQRATSVEPMGTHIASMIRRAMTP